MEDFPLSASEPFRWRRGDLAGFAFFFIGTVVVLPVFLFLVLGAFSIDFKPGGLSGVTQILIQAVIDLLLVGYIFFTVKVLHGQSLRATLRWIPRPDFPPASLVASGAFLALTVLIVSVFLPTPADSALEDLLSTTASIVVFVIFGAAVAPLLEEIVFRGFLYSVLADLYGTGVAVPVTAVLFAALHVSQLRGNWPAVLLILLVGYIFTVVRKRSESLIPSVIMHTAYNTMIFGVSALSALVEHTKVG